MSASRSLQTVLKYLPFPVLALFIVDIFTFRFTDRFLSGTGFGVIGLDFFSVPRAFINLVEGISIFETDHASWYGSHASPYYYHPAVSVAVGAWTSALPPGIALLSFILVSAALLIYTGIEWKRHFTDPLHKYGSMAMVCCSLPVYLMLWHGQMHVFTVVSVVLILSGVMDIKTNGKTGIKLVAGLLLSLLSKPVILLWIPALLIMKETRKGTLTAIGWYVLVSLVFLAVPFLNPQDDNQVHWTNILANTTDTHIHQNIYSFVNTFSRFYKGRLLNMLCLVVPVVLVLAGSRLLKVKDLEERVDVLIILMLALLCSYYFAYTTVWEYHYTTLIACLPAVLYLLLQSSGRERRYLKIIFIAGLALYLPTTYIITPQPNKAGVVVMQLCKIIPVVVMLSVLIVVLTSRLRRTY